VRFDDVGERNEALPCLLELGVLKFLLNQSFIVPDIGESISVKVIHRFVIQLSSGDCNEYSFKDPEVRLDEHHLVITWTVHTVDRPVTIGPQPLGDIGIIGKDAVGSEQHLACAQTYSIRSLFSAYVQLPDDYWEPDDRHETGNY
jgi:hypothetical protein